ncbi:hypothetical protein [Sphingosinicella rhizophila]|uniref:Uncharacterized protein n=1 Tax=Sphingosinicella rhizophila TaxID=3050082 RepID=A0ABU3Q445_9SPHN|nr:hypothetical protein [Sphingosinicella sp. GR2756]MDT9598193.1 hypothetical protein [Sphingosinicella sp. GR2756]
MMAKTPNNQAEIIDNPHIRDLFATQALSFSMVGTSNVSITLSSARWSPVKKAVQHVVVERVVMPLTGAQNMAVALNDFLIKQGHDPSAAITAGESRQ